MNSQIFSYHGSEICFKADKDSVMINATEMARPFNKRPIDWIRLGTTQEFLTTLREVRNPHITPEESAGLIITERGNFSDGREQGTWMHEDVALEFARWLSPTFAIWCNDRIKELLKHGITATDKTIENLIANPENAIKVFTALLEERDKNKRLQAYNQEHIKKLEQQAPKVVFADAVSSSGRSILIGELAKIITQNGYEIGQNRLFTWLREHGYLGTRGENYNIPVQSSMEMGLFEIKETTITQPGGTTIISITPKVTGKGQIYFINKFMNFLSKKV